MPTPAMGGGGGGGERAPPPHRSSGAGGGGNELFICFTSRPSTSSSAAVRAPSARSLPSPSRARDPSSLPASRSRRLRASGSLRGGQSPMFPPRKGGAFRPAEPSSPKVTCIGQVRVKPKAKDSALLRSESRNPGGSSRRTGEEERWVGGEQGRESSRVRSHSWVYQLPASICEALRAIGSEFNCFLPCGGGRSPCSGSSRSEKAGSRGAVGREKRPSGSCGAVFVRWLMAVEEGEEGEKGEVVGLVVGEREGGDLGLVFGERGEGKVEEFGVAEKVEKKEEVLVVKVEEEEVVCVPPKNALLLMRCRSDPVRMAALANRFWGSPGTKVQVEKEEEEEEEEEEAEEGESEGCEEGEDDGKHRLEEEEQEVEEEKDGEELKDDSKESTKALPSERGEAEERESGSDRVSETLVQNVPVEEKDNASEKNGGEVKEKLHLDEEKNRENVEEVEDIIKEGTLDGTLEVQRKQTEAEGVHETQLQEMPKEKDRDEARLQEREEEKEEEEMNGRRSNSCSSCKAKDSTRSGGYSSKYKKEGIRRSSSCREKEGPKHSFAVEGERRHSFSVEKEARRASFSIDREGRKSWSFSVEKGEIRVSLEEPAVALGGPEQKKERSVEEDELKETGEAEKSKTTGETQVVAEEKREEEEEGEEGEEQEEEEEKRGGELPDCLLLMMYEPKLSMEVSRETWVCSTDFIHGHLHQSHSRRRPPRPTKGKSGKSKSKAAVDKGGHGEKGEKKEVNPSTESSIERPPPLPQVLPPAAAIEHKLLTGTAAALAPPYGPFVLTRCKSEPMRSSARLAADAGFWKNRHQPINAAAIGF